MYLPTHAKPPHTLHVLPPYTTPVSTSDGTNPTNAPSFQKRVAACGLFSASYLPFTGPFHYNIKSGVLYLSSMVNTPNVQLEHPNFNCINKCVPVVLFPVLLARLYGTFLHCCKPTYTYIVLLWHDNYVVKALYYQ